MQVCRGGVCCSSDGGKLLPAELVGVARRNCEKYQWAAEIRRGIIDDAAAWLDMPDDQLWELMPPPTITRSWMVWSDGWCPSCKRGVPMYNWKIDAMGARWKVRCPHCDRLFPTNDFQAFYNSGLDSSGVFDPAKADRSLLFNAEHPDASDPLRMFGVDDGNGYSDGEHLWRFIGAYIIYGQWKQAVVEGIRRLSAAYAVTGDARYAHKAGVMLDRVADLYPSFDFKAQAVLYEGKSTGAGYVSVWHDACEETRELAAAYDIVFDGIKTDQALVTYLESRAQRHGLANAKKSFGDIQRNIEERLLRDPLTNIAKITSNYPRTPFAEATIRAVLGWPDSKPDVYRLIGEVIDRATAVDGVSGEKGLAAYTAYSTQGLALMLAQFSRMDPEFLGNMLREYPRLQETYRFHMDTWCLGKFYPNVGDGGVFARPLPVYAGAFFSKRPGTGASTYKLFYDMARLTGDDRYLQVLAGAAKGSDLGDSYDIFSTDPQSVKAAVKRVASTAGPVPEVKSVNKQQWGIAVLRSGEGQAQRALWLNYDSGKAHGHADGMNLGLLAYGQDLLPDFGYPPVNYGGWESEKAVWYTQSAAHNTAVVDGRNTAAVLGSTTAWADGKWFHAVRASGAQMMGTQQFERTAALVDCSKTAFYVLDIFRIKGGSSHVWSLGSSFGKLSLRGLDLTPSDAPVAGIMRDFKTARDAPAGWTAEWKLGGFPPYLPAPSGPLQLKVHGLTSRADVTACQAWVNAGLYEEVVERWVDRLILKREGEAGLSSAYVSVLEAYEEQAEVVRAGRLGVKSATGARQPDSVVAVEIELASGETDVVVASDPARPSRPLSVDRCGIEFDGVMCVVRKPADRRPLRAAVIGCRSLVIGGKTVAIPAGDPFAEVELAR